MISNKFLTLFLMLLVSNLYSNNEIIIQNLEELSSIKIEYNVRQLTKPYYIITKKSDKSSTEVYSIDALDIFFKSLDKNLKVRFNDYYTGNSTQLTFRKYVSFITYTVSLYGKYNLLIWKQIPQGYKLIAHYCKLYPNVLYGATRNISFNHDTLVVNNLASDVEDVWGTKYYYILKDDKNPLKLIIREEISGTEANPESGGNPTKNSSSRQIRRYYFFDENKIIKKRLLFNAYYSDGSFVFGKGIYSMLDVIYPTMNYPNRQNYRNKKVIDVGKSTFLVGPKRGDYIPILWEDKWVIADFDDIEIIEKKGNNK